MECSPTLSLCPSGRVLLIFPPFTLLLLPDSECRVEGSRRGLCCPSNGTTTEKTSTAVDEDSLVISVLMNWKYFLAVLDSSLLTNSVLNSLLTSVKSSSVCPHGDTLKEEKEELRCTPHDVSYDPSSLPIGTLSRVHVLPLITVSYPRDQREFVVLIRVRQSIFL